MAEAQEDRYTWDYPVEKVSLNVEPEFHAWKWVNFMVVMAFVSFVFLVLIVVRWIKGGLYE